MPNAKKKREARLDALARAYKASTKWRWSVSQSEIIGVSTDKGGDEFGGICQVGPETWPSSVWNLADDPERVLRDAEFIVLAHRMMPTLLRLARSHRTRRK